MCIESKQYFNLLHELETQLQRAGLPASETSLLAMHLAEIEEESINYQQLLANVSGKKNASNGQSDELLDQLVEVQVSLEHIKSHHEAARKLLSKSIERLDNEEE